MRTLTALLIVSALFACKPPVEEEPTPEPLFRKTLSGSVTWTVDFDADAEAAGHTDCSYTRSYEGVEDDAIPWTCPDCTRIFRTTIELSDGESCYAQISSGQPTETEWIGFNDDTWYRAVGGGALGEQGAKTGTTAVTVEHLIEDRDSPDGGTHDFIIEGSFGIGEEEGDPRHGMNVPDSYECGWPKADPEPYSGNYQLFRNRLIPDAVLTDQCGEAVRLHDFKGMYLIVDIAAIDCPPCRMMAEEEPAFLEQMANEGLDVELITFLAPSLSDTAGTPTGREINDWVDDFDIHSPVLGDRAYGLAVVEPGVPDYGYPTAVIVDPNLRVLDFSTGFGANTFDDFAQIIRDDAAGN